MCRLVSYLTFAGACLVMAACAVHAPETGPTPIAWDELAAVQSEAVEALDSLRTLTARSGMKPLAIATRPNHPPELASVLASISDRTGLPRRDVSSSSRCRDTSCLAVDRIIDDEYSVVEFHSIWRPDDDHLVIYFRTSDNYHLWGSRFAGLDADLRFVCWGRAEDCHEGGI